MSERASAAIPERDDRTIHEWFSLTCANYLVVPRSVLQSMPEDWQHAFVGLLEQMEQRYRHLDWPDYDVRCRGNGGHYRADPIPHYNRGRTRIEPDQNGSQEAPR